MQINQKNISTKETVLVLCRDPRHMGGVTNYWNTVFKHYKSKSINIERFIIGRRPGKSSNSYYVIVTLFDFLRFIFRLYREQYSLIHLNPSLGIVAILRDSIFLLIAKLFSKPVLIFWHGWNIKIEKLLENHTILMLLFKGVFKKANAFIVLASSFKQKLRDWGFNQKIIIDTTTVDDNLLSGFSLEKKIKEIKGSGILQILFFSRIEVEKGILETIDAFSKLKLKNRDVLLVIAGDGSDFELVNKHLIKLGDGRIKLIGYIRGEEKRKILDSSHLMCLPSSYGEGLPIAIIEAMAFGMPIITRPVGGIPDIFIEGQNGYYAQSLDQNYLSNLLKDTLDNKIKMSTISENNYIYAQNHLKASIVAKRLDKIFNYMICGD